MYRGPRVDRQAAVRRRRRRVDPQHAEPRHAAAPRRGGQPPRVRVRAAGARRGPARGEQGRCDARRHRARQQLPHRAVAAAHRQRPGAVLAAMRRDRDAAHGAGAHGAHVPAARGGVPPDVRQSDRVRDTGDARGQDVQRGRDRLLVGLRRAPAPPRHAHAHVLRVPALRQDQVQVRVHRAAIAAGAARGGTPTQAGHRVDARRAGLLDVLRAALARRRPRPDGARRLDGGDGGRGRRGGLRWCW
mmetsp:Transcript_575/g.1647  ORF Transcript_575/g.1647 Transcript_575/m.1647 type:complete len:245 (-) Transcript_575:86-820(-)